MNALVVYRVTGAYGPDTDALTALIGEYAAQREAWGHVSDRDQNVYDHVRDRYVNDDWGGRWHAFLATVDAAPAGCVLLDLPEAGRVAEARKLWVRPVFRGNRLGRELMRAAIGQARAGGCVRVKLTVHKDRQVANALYQRMGFLPRWIDSGNYDLLDRRL